VGDVKGNLKVSGANSEDTQPNSDDPSAGARLAKKPGERGEVRGEEGGNAVKKRFDPLVDVKSKDLTPKSFPEGFSDLVKILSNFFKYYVLFKVVDLSLNYFFGFSINFCIPWALVGLGVYWNYRRMKAFSIGQQLISEYQNKTKIDEKLISHMEEMLETNKQIISAHEETIKNKENIISISQELISNNERAFLLSEKIKSNQEKMIQNFETIIELLQNEIVVLREKLHENEDPTVEKPFLSQTILKGSDADHGDYLKFQILFEGFGYFEILFYKTGKRARISKISSVEDDSSSRKQMESLTVSLDENAQWKDIALNVNQIINEGKSYEDYWHVTNATFYNPKLSPEALNDSNPEEVLKNLPTLIHLLAWFDSELEENDNENLTGEEYEFVLNLSKTLQSHFNEITGGARLAEDDDFVIKITGLLDKIVSKVLFGTTVGRQILACLIPIASFGASINPVYTLIPPFYSISWIAAILSAEMMMAPARTKRFFSKDQADSGARLAGEEEPSKKTPRLSVKTFDGFDKPDFDWEDTFDLREYDYWFDELESLRIFGNFLDHFWVFVKDENAAQKLNYLKSPKTFTEFERFINEETGFSVDEAYKAASKLQETFLGYQKLVDSDNYLKWMGLYIFGKVLTREDLLFNLDMDPKSHKQLLVNAPRVFRTIRQVASKKGGLFSLDDLVERYNQNAQIDRDRGMDALKNNPMALEYAQRQFDLEKDILEMKKRLAELESETQDEELLKSGKPLEEKTAWEVLESEFYLDSLSKDDVILGDVHQSMGVLNRDQAKQVFSRALRILFYQLSGARLAQKPGKGKEVRGERRDQSRKDELSYVSPEFEGNLKASGARFAVDKNDLRFVAGVYDRLLETKDVSGENSPYNTPSKRFQLVRELCYLSQEKMAQFLDVSYSSVNGWEGPGRRPGREMSYKSYDKIKAKFGEVIMNFIKTGFLPRTISETSGANNTRTSEVESKILSSDGVVESYSNENNIDKMLGEFFNSASQWFNTPIPFPATSLLKMGRQGIARLIALFDNGDLATQLFIKYSLCRITPPLSKVVLDSIITGEVSPIGDFLKVNKGGFNLSLLLFATKTTTRSSLSPLDFLIIDEILFHLQTKITSARNSLITKENGARLTLNSWDQATTDPSQHNSKSFRYIVHAVQDPTLRLLRDVHMNIFKIQGTKVDPGRSIDLIKEPSRIYEKPVISASFIDQDHRGTWGPAGFILKVPSQNIISTNAHDIGSPIDEGWDWVREKLASRWLINPQELLKQSSYTLYNELEVAGTYPDDESKKVEIIGVFVKINSQGKPFGSLEWVSKVQSVAYRLGLPIVRIEDLGFSYPDERPSVSGDGLISYQRNGERYIAQKKAEGTHWEILYNKQVESGSYISGRSMTQNEKSNFIREVQHQVEGLQGDEDGRRKLKEALEWLKIPGNSGDTQLNSDNPNSGARLAETVLATFDSPVHWTAWGKDGSLGEESAFYQNISLDLSKEDPSKIFFRYYPELKYDQVVANFLARWLPRDRFKPDLPIGLNKKIYQATPSGIITIPLLEFMTTETGLDPAFVLQSEDLTALAQTSLHSGRSAWIGQKTVDFRDLNPNKKQIVSFKKIEVLRVDGARLAEDFVRPLHAARPKEFFGKNIAVMDENHRLSTLDFDLDKRGHVLMRILGDPAEIWYDLGVFSRTHPASAGPGDNLTAGQVKASKVILEDSVFSDLAKIDAKFGRPNQPLVVVFAQEGMGFQELKLLVADTLTFKLTKPELAKNLEARLLSVSAKTRTLLSQIQSEISEQIKKTVPTHKRPLFETLLTQTIQELLASQIPSDIQVLRYQADTSIFAKPVKDSRVLDLPLQASTRGTPRSYLSLYYLARGAQASGLFEKNLDDGLLSIYAKLSGIPVGQWSRASQIISKVADDQPVSRQEILLILLKASLEKLSSGLDLATVLIRHILRAA
jgi:DNA-binding XRE family transcriptional regulator